MTRRTALLSSGAAGTLALALLLAGCGGGSGKQAATTAAPTEQTVRSPGYSFAAPAAWKAVLNGTAASATGPGAGLLTVNVYRLVKRYDPKKAEAAARELDGVAKRLAAGRKGKVAAAETAKVAGIPSRSYRIEYALKGDNLVQQVTFVLRDTTEWLLVCRRAAADSYDVCARFRSSFSLASR